MGWFWRFGATQGAQLGWTTHAAWPYLGSGVVVLGLYIIWALRTAHPAVDLKLLRHAQTALAVSLCTLVSVVLFVMVFLLPIFLEQVQGLSPLVAGAGSAAQGLVTGLGTVLGSRLAARRGVRFSALLGMVILTLSTLALLLVTITTPAGVTAVIWSGRGLALGLTIQPLLDALIDGLSQAEVPDGNTLFNVAQRLGGSIGVPLLATFFGLRERVRVAQVRRASPPRSKASRACSVLRSAVICLDRWGFGHRVCSAAWWHPIEKLPWFEIE